MKVLNLPIPFFVPITLSTHFLSYTSYNEPNIPNMHSHTHYLTQESNKDPLMVGSTLLRKLWGLTFQFSSDMLPTRCLWLNHFYFLEGNGNPLQGKSLPGKSHGQRSLVGLQSMVSLRVGHDWVTSLSLFTVMHWRRKWQPTPVFLSGESLGRQSLVCCHLWGCTESDTTEVT